LRGKNNVIGVSYQESDGLEDNKPIEK